MKIEKFSVAICVYKSDCATHFERALISITELQTIKPDEIVLVVDGYIDDDLNNVILKYERKYSTFNVIRLSKNKGLGNALHIAVKNCHYDLIARMDSDDVAVPSRFEEQLNFFLKNPTVDVVGGDIVEFIDQENNLVGRRSVPINHCDICEYMKRRCPFNHMTVMYRKSALQKSGGYLDLFCNEDYYLWIRMMNAKVKFANTGTILVKVRVGKEMYGRRGGLKYFKSELQLQNLMLKTKVITLRRYLINIFERMILQILMPNRLRGFIFRKFAREKCDKERRMNNG